MFLRYVCVGVREVVLPLWHPEPPRPPETPRHLVSQGHRLVFQQPSVTVWFTPISVRFPATISASEPSRKGNLTLIGVMLLWKDLHWAVFLNRRLTPPVREI